MSIVPFDDRAPSGPDVTAYDEQLRATYWRLLDAAADNAEWGEVVRVVFGIDPVAEPERASLVHDTHLARARWMSETGYRHYLDPQIRGHGSK
ncbi:DUF2285 domain-containing protein [Staphylococcus epidermidis]|uniref:DUF2285 domain-containing protein n=2 Tax=Staphylococcus epidermidis TaxID=1282 RepID=A0AAE5QU77_STAEP|nr:DUF2285 domain-containing protein [Staphylococcus epidermidis]